MTLAYWKRQQLAQDVVASRSAAPRLFTCAAAWQAWLTAAGVTTVRHIRIATEGALLGPLLEPGVSPLLMILSDGAPQFDILVHASCWVHAERPLARAIPYTEAHRAAREQVRQQLWDWYQDLKAHRAQPEPRDKAGLEARFDLLVGQKTDYPTTLGAALKERRGPKADLLRVLERPEVPLHNNGTASIIRGYVKTRQISGSTRSEAGRRCRDTFASLKKTSRKWGERFWEYRRDRVGNRGKFPRLADLLRQRAAEGQDAGIAEAVPA